eukprot:5787225-Heterocapsa_arctica.AAC.1
MVNASWVELSSLGCRAELDADGGASGHTCVGLEGRQSQRVQLFQEAVQCLKVPIAQQQWHLTC